MRRLAVISSSTVTKRQRDASCLSVVSFSGRIPRTELLFIISYFGFGFTNTTPKTTEQHLLVCSGKSGAEVAIIRDCA